MSYLDRIVADSVDRETWLAARPGIIGASDVAHYSKLESADKYVLAKLGSGKFTGNSWTESGNEWEPIMLGMLGIPRNTLLVHAEGNPQHAATPDGVEVLPDGEIVLTEAKAIHGRIIDGPTIAHLRQMWWAQYCWGARRSKFVWQEIQNGQPRRLEPHVVMVDRDDTQIDKLKIIADRVLEGIAAARKEMEWMR